MYNFQINENIFVVWSWYSSEAFLLTGMNVMRHYVATGPCTLGVVFVLMSEDYGLTLWLPSPSIELTAWYI
jgi:hypothetical protein